MGHFASYYKSKLSYVWDADFLAFWERTSGTPDTWKTAYNDLFINLKAYGLLQNADVLHVYAGHNSSDSLLNLVKNAHNGIPRNSPLFTSKDGFKGDGISAYIDIDFKPYYDAINYSLNDASLSVYIYQPHTDAAYRFLAGSYAGTDLLWLGATGDSFDGVNGSAYYQSMIAPKIGLKSISMLSNTLTLRYGSDMQTHSTAPVLMPYSSVYLFDINYAGSPNGLYTNTGASALMLGKALTNVTHAAFEQCILTFKLSIAAL